VLNDKLLDSIVKKTAIVENVVVSVKSKLEGKLAKQLTGKKQSRLLGIEKLEDANLAGTR
jgi:DNA topoisomerase-2